MVGQLNLKNEIDMAVENGFPHFVVLSGEQGSGKKLIVDYIVEKTGFMKAVCGNKVEEVREVIQTVYNQTAPIIYVFYDVDDMSVNAKNALLKVTEEPPKNTYFIMTLNSENKALETIMSRAVKFRMGVYTYNELSEYFDLVVEDKNVDKKRMLSIVEVPRDIDLLLSYDFGQYYAFCEQVVDNLAFVSDANSLKIVEKLAVKDEGWDIKLFINTIKLIIGLRQKSGDLKECYESIRLCTVFINQLANKSFNKRMLCDDWILQLKGALYGVA